MAAFPDDHMATSLHLSRTLGSYQQLLADDVYRWPSTHSRHAHRCLRLNLGSLISFCGCSLAGRACSWRALGYGTCSRTSQTRCCWPEAHWIPSSHHRYSRTRKRCAWIASCAMCKEGVWVFPEADPKDLHVMLWLSSQPLHWPVICKTKYCPFVSVWCAEPEGDGQPPAEPLAGHLPQGGACSHLPGAGQLSRDT